MQKIQKLEMQTKVKELALEEKNIEIRKKELELESYKNLVDGFENITEASDLTSCWPITSEINLNPTRGPARQSPEKINMGNPDGSKQDIKIPEIEIPRPRLPVPERQPALGVVDCFSQPIAKNKEDMQPTMWAMMPRGLLEDKGICFMGKDVSEYPAYRHRFSTNYKEYRYSRPDILLRWIESTIQGQAQRFIRNAFAVMNPGEACDMIWDTLEEVYGRPDIILEHATQQVKRQAHSIGHDRQNLLEFRADLRNLKGVATSVGQVSSLDRPALLGQLYTAFTEKLRSRFDAKYSATTWVFNKFIQFLTDEISHIDSLHLMHVELSEKTSRRVGERQKTLPFSKQKILNNTIATVADGTKSVVETTNIKGGKCWIHSDTTSHALPQCRSFLAMTVDEQWKFVKEHRLCFVCFGTYHISKDCDTTLKCEKCRELHHVLLHRSEKAHPMASHQNQGQLEIDLVI